MNRPPASASSRGTVAVFERSQHFVGAADRARSRTTALSALAIIVFDTVDDLSNAV